MVDPVDWRRRDPTSGRTRWRLGVRGFAALAAFSSVILWRLAIVRGSRRATQPVIAGHHNQENPETAFEPTDWPLGPVGVIFAGTLVLLVISPLVLIIAYPTAFPDVGRTLRIAPPGPRLETDPEADLARFRAEESKRLNSYYWIDRQKGIVHIPIEQAMQNLVRTGAPGFPKGQQ